MEQKVLKKKKQIKESIIDKIIYDKNPNYDNRGFYTWQIKGKFKYENVKLHFSDTPSGCGPIQMYNYSEIHKDNYDNFKLLLNTLIYDCMIPIKHWFRSRTPTAITFVQGNPTELFDQLMTEIGFEIRSYVNIAHGHNSDDMQSFYYLDITKLI